jgi:hypothetical protein
VELWQKLYREKHDCGERLRDPAFREAAVVYGDINDYIERTWSEERYIDAVASFRDAFVIHDIALRKSVVHTDYRDLDKTVLDPSRTILTHGPDKITSSWILCEAEKHYRVRGTAFTELVGTHEYPFCADFYHKEGGRYYVCFRDDTSPHGVYERDGILFLSTDPYRGHARLVCTVAIYEDIRGEYFPKLDDDTTFYNVRPDGRVERITMGDTHSRGEIASNQRPRLTKQYAGAAPAAPPIFSPAN